MPIGRPDRDSNGLVDFGEALRDKLDDLLDLLPFRAVPGEKRLVDHRDVHHGSVISY